MGRRDLSEIKATVVKHNRILREFGFTLRQRRRMINSFNHVKISHDTLWRWDSEELSTMKITLSDRITPLSDNNLTADLQESDNLGWRCRTCGVGMLVFDDDSDEIACNKCGLVVEKVRKLTIDYGTQTEQYQPTLSSSFNKGLGSAQPEAFICWIIKHAGTKRKLSSFEVRGELFQLRKHISSKDADAKLNQILQHLTRRMQEIKGFDPGSDKDSQFVTLDELGRFLCRARESLGTYRFSATKLVDALLVHTLGDDARRIIEAPRKHLKCPRCRKQTAFAPDNDNKLILCVECGKPIPVDQAKFKITYTPIEQKYAKTIERILIHVKAPQPTIQTDTSLSPTQPSEPQSSRTPIVLEAH